METDDGVKTDPHEIWFTKTDSVKVTNEKSPASELARTLYCGETLKVTEKSGSRFQIELDDGKSGEHQTLSYLSRILLTNPNPLRVLPHSLSKVT